MHLVGDPANRVGNSLEDDNPSKPAVDEVHGVEGDARQLDDWVVAASEEEEGNHVDDGHDTGAAEEFTSARGKGAVINLPDAETNVDAQVANQEEGLQAAGQGANTNGG